MYLEAARISEFAVGVADQLSASPSSFHELLVRGHHWSGGLKGAGLGDFSNNQTAFVSVDVEEQYF